MEIPCTEKQPVQFAGGEFIRIGTNKKNLKEYPDKERELWIAFDSAPYELRIAIFHIGCNLSFAKFHLYRWLRKI